MKATDLIIRVGFLFWIFVGAAGGFYAGKANVLERILDDKIECSLKINPITMEQLK